jgi:hypothetical protein
MRFDTKIAIVVRAGLLPWQQLNVTAFLASGIAAANQETIGQPYEDGAGNTYTELFRQPVLIYEGEDLSQVHGRALARGLPAGVYTMQMFGTDNDDDNRAVVAAASALDLAGIAVYGPRNAVDKVIKGVTLHP